MITQNFERKFDRRAARGVIRAELTYLLFYNHYDKFFDVTGISSENFMRVYNFVDVLVVC